ncbi:RcpC/CpaB family pilus assembly protein [Candidatus Solirubrobacter pratensis]|uniref:RcpC/CpaB family pilus assembly protein n=1 Tax=Candidatus Solirubrobacter pratensis TaxID=1298857 RepID=UPI000400C415|nr:RcpC/CpaB family pilus assembly protein [Candidatus Solirubrobacter pratensis]
MTRRRRALLLLGLALALGGLAATDVSRRERALRAQVGELTDVVVARRALAAGHVVRLEDLGVRRLPARYAPAGPPTFAGALAGRRLAVPVPSGGVVTGELIERAPATPEASVERGERAIEVLASGSPQAVVAGAHVDVVVTTDRRGGTAGSARLALENVEVLAARAAAGEDKAPRVAATLRVTAAQAVYLAAAGSFAADVRLLARAPGDRRRVGALSVDDGL